jgi:vacuolar-type H+-ATPase subunit H
MPDNRTTRKAGGDRFWDRFVERARKNGVKVTAVRWHVLRAEQYLKAFPDKRLSVHSAEDVTAYLETVGRIDRILDWQFVQIVDAIQNLLLTAGAAAADEVDWAYWRDSVRTLASNHPTIAREGGSPSNEPVSGARFKEKRSPPSALDAARKEHAQLLERLAAEIRRRRYSIRTERKRGTDHYSSSPENAVCRRFLVSEVSLKLSHHILRRFGLR